MFCVLPSLFLLPPPPADEPVMRLWEGNGRAGAPLPLTVRKALDAGCSGIDQTPQCCPLPFSIQLKSKLKSASPHQ